MTPKEKSPEKALEIAQKKRRQIRLAAGFYDAQLSEREYAITRCEVDDVSPQELRALLIRLQRVRCPLETIGAVRIHYDHLIDDAEKALRQHLGLETDYSHKVSQCGRDTGGRLFGHIDGIPMSVWCLLYLPEKATKKKPQVSNAIKWCRQNGFLTDAEWLRQEYADIISPQVEPAKLTPFELRLLNDDIFCPDNASNIIQAIKRMEKKGFVVEADMVREKYEDFLCKDLPPPKCTLEEAEAMYRALMGRK